MSLPESVQHKLSVELAKDNLLKQELADEISSNLNEGTPINWNLILNTQLEHEKGGSDATNS